MTDQLCGNLKKNLQYLIFNLGIYIMSEMKKKIQNMMMTYAPYADGHDPLVMTFYGTKAISTTANKQYKLPELQKDLEEILNYIEELESKL